MEIDVQEKIVAAAREVFMEKGFAAASMQKIADRAGVNKGLLHYYKWDKRKLFLRIFEEAFAKFAVRLNEVLDSDRTLTEKIELFIEQYMAMLLENPHLPPFIINELNQHPREFIALVLRKKNKPDPARFLVQIQLEVQAGRIREVNPFHFFLNLLSMCVFPFLARPMIQGLLQIDDDTYSQLMATRKKEITDYALRAVQKPEDRI